MFEHWRYYGLCSDLKTTKSIMLISFSPESPCKDIRRTNTVLRTLLLPCRTKLLRMLRAPTRTCDGSQVVSSSTRHRRTHLSRHAFLKRFGMQLLTPTSVSTAARALSGEHRHSVTNMQNADSTSSGLVPNNLQRVYLRRLFEE